MFPRDEKKPASPLFITRESTRRNADVMTQRRDKSLTEKREREGEREREGRGGGRRRGKSEQERVKALDPSRRIAYLCTSHIYEHDDARDGGRADGR